MEISVLDMAYWISVNTNTSEKTALLAKYLTSVSARDHDCFTFTVNVATFLAVRNLKFLAMFTCFHVISNLLKIIQLVMIFQSEK